MIESWKQSGLVAAAIAMAIAIGGWLQACSVGNRPATVSAATGTTPGQASVTMAQSGSGSAATADGPVAFVVCSDATGYRKVTPSEMQTVFGNPRFGDGVKPGPFYWTIYESDYYWIQEPHAISANVENSALSAGTLVAGGSMTNGDAYGCRGANQDASYQALWIYDHHVVAMRVDAGVLTVEVDSRPGTREDVDFPQPPLPRHVPPTKDDSVPFTTLRIVDTTGHLLASRGTGVSAWEFDDSGAVVSGEVSAAGSPTTIGLRVGTDLAFVCGGLPRGAARLVLQPTTGASITLEATACTSPWDVAASVHLTPGEWTIRADDGAYYTVLPKDGPRP